MAAVCLADAAQYMERVYATNLRYDLNNGAATALPAAQCRSDLAARYTIALDPAALQQRAYSVSAAPLGAQAAADTACATLAIDQTGTKSISGSGSVAACWR
jgi:type IV pilus assembly protein PilE